MSRFLLLVVSHRRIGVTSHQSCSTPIPHRTSGGTVPPLSIPARTFRLIPAKNNDGKIIQAIPPPPPYHASVRNAIHRNEINQITTQIQQSCSTNVFNVSASSSSSSSSSTVTTNINAINASSGSSASYVNRNPVKPAGANETDDTDELEPSHTDEIITADDYENQIDIGCRIESDDDELGSENEPPTGETGKSNEFNQKQQRSKQHKDTIGKGSTLAVTSSSKEMRNSFKQEAADSMATDVENVNDKRARGLKVLSNVQVSPNAILNVSLNSPNNDSIPLNNMIIVSSMPSTSTATTSQQVLSSTQLTKTQSLLKNLSDSRTMSESRNSKHTKANVEVSISIYKMPLISVNQLFVTNRNSIFFLF